MCLLSSADIVTTCTYMYCPFISAPEDFQSQTGILTFSSDVTKSCVSIVIVDDNVQESGPECFTVSIVSATGDVESPSVATVCISDNDGMYGFSTIDNIIHVHCTNFI